MSLAKSALEVMNTSVNRSSEGRFVVSDDSQMAHEKYGFIAHVFFGVISVLAFVGNFLICVVILRKKRLLSKQYNILILNLAVTDLLTAIFLAATPDFVIPDDLFPVPVNIAGELFCRLIGSTYVLFTFGKASTLTVMCMAVERWYAVVKPVRYKVTFRKRRLGFYIFIVWLFSCSTQINELFQVSARDNHCKSIIPPYGKQISQILTLFHIAMTFYIPSIVTWMTFTDVWMSMRRSRKISTHNVTNSFGVAKRRIVRMCAITAFLLTLCWFPAETFFILLTFRTLVLPHSFYQFTIIMAMFNSCVNPVIYCLSNKEYRKDFLELFYRCDRVEVLGTVNQCNRKSFGVQSYRKSLGGESYDTSIGMRRCSLRNDLARSRKPAIVLLPSFLENEVINDERTNNRRL